MSLIPARLPTLTRRLLPARLAGLCLLGAASAALATDSAPARGADAVAAALKLTAVELHEKGARAPDLEGTLPGGVRIGVDMDHDGRVEEIEREGHELFPAAAIAEFVPQQVRANTAYPADATLDKIELHDGHGIEIEGVDATGRRFKAEFSRNGDLVEMKRD